MIEFNDEEQDIILMALYHYELEWVSDEVRKAVGEKFAVKELKRINLIIDRIIKDYP